MSNKRQFPIREIVDLLRIPHKSPTGSSMDCDCPNCNRKGKMNAVISGHKANIWRCNYCGESGGTMDLYSLVTRGFMYRDLPKESRSEVIQEIEQALGLSSDSPVQNPAYLRKTFVDTSSADYISSQYSELTDDALNYFHQCILDNPLLELRLKDRNHLLDRGLSREAIQKNQYRSFCADNIIKKVPGEWLRRYETENWEKIKNSNPVLAKLSKKQLLTGLLVGQCLMDENEGITPCGVAGAYEFKTPGGVLWGFRLYDGILIPIRNQDGAVVGLQIRSTGNHKGSKYMLVSSRGMPNGRVGKTRIHFPLANQEGNRKGAQTVILTEGPLKSDVYCHLDPQSSHKVMALIGVNTTSELADALQAGNFHAVYDGFDMDKLINPAVMNGLSKIKSLSKESNLQFYHLFWDEESTEKLLEKYIKYCNFVGVELPPLKSDLPVSRLSQIRLHLDSKGIDVPETLAKWPSATKGIDDFMFSRRKAVET